MFIASTALLRFMGLGWIGAIVGGLIVTAAYFAFMYLMLKKRR